MGIWAYSKCNQCGLLLQLITLQVSIKGCLPYHESAGGFLSLVSMTFCTFCQMAPSQDRPTKICAVCGRPFQWRRKWKDVWDEVRYCSERCRRRRGAAAARPSH